MKIERINKGNWGKVRAFFDLRTEDNFIIKGFKIIEGINGKFVGMPSTKNDQGEYFPSVWADESTKSELEQLAMRAYGQDSVTNSSSNDGSQSSSVEEASEATNSEENKEVVKSEEFNEDDIPF